MVARPKNDRLIDYWGLLLFNITPVNIRQVYDWNYSVVLEHCCSFVR